MTYNASDPESVERNKQYQRKWYLANKEKQRKRIKSNNQKARLRNKFFVDKIKASGCSTEGCVENHIAALDAHHLDPSTKEYTIARMVNGAWSLARLQEEIDKCIILCANCHRKLHAGS